MYIFLLFLTFRSSSLSLSLSSDFTFFLCLHLHPSFYRFPQWDEFTLILSLYRTALGFQLYALTKLEWWNVYILLNEIRVSKEILLSLLYGIRTTGSKSLSISVVGVWNYRNQIAVFCRSINQICFLRIAESMCTHRNLMISLSF